MIERYQIEDRDTWLAMRSHDLTASDIGAAIGVDPYKTPLQLYGEKTGVIMPAGDSNLMRRGRWLESAVIEALGEQHPSWVIERPKFYLRDPELRLGATPDALAATDEPGITNIQCKVVSKPAFERDWAEGPPLHYVLQTATEGLLLGSARSMLAVLVIDTYSAELHEFPVPRHADAERRVQEIAAEFWRNIAEGKRPAADYRRDDETVAAMFPVSKAEPVLSLAGDNRLGELLPTRAVLKDEIARLTREVEAIDVEIKDKLGEHEIAELPGWRLSWKTQHRAERIMPASSFRVLRVTDKRMKEEIAA